jgi:hypothetical protein
MQSNGHKTLVVATSMHPNRPEGEEYMLTTALVDELTSRGFVVMPGERTDRAKEVLPKMVEIVKPKVKLSKKVIK